MITDILTLTPDFNFKEMIQFKTMIDESESGQEMPDALIDNGLREFNLTVSYVDQTMMDYIWNFYISRQGKTDDFLMKIITNFSTTDEPVGTGDGTTRDFLLHNFPVDTTDNHSAKINGISTALYTLSNDTANEKSYIIFNSPPALGDVITASYEYYFRVRFKEDRLTRKLMNYKLLSSGIDLVEVRWNTYFPYSGNSSSSSSSSSQGGIETKYFSISGYSSVENYPSSEDMPVQFFDYQPKQQNCAQVIPIDLIVRRIRIYLTTAPGFGKKRVFTLYHNDEPTSLQFTIADTEKVGECNLDISCSVGDTIFMRMDNYNTPANATINIGGLLVTTDPRRQPILGPSQVLTYCALLSNSSFSNFFSDPYGPYKNLDYMSLITTPGIIRNLIFKATTIWWFGNFPGNTKPLSIVKKVGDDKFYDNDGLEVSIDGPNLEFTNNDDFIIVLPGDYAAFDSTVGGGYSGQGGASCEFYSTYPKHSIQACSVEYNVSASDAYGVIYDIMRSKRLSQRQEACCVFTASGIITNFTIVIQNAFIKNGSPLIYTLRKNGVDTDFVITLSTGMSQYTYPGFLRVAYGDRISIKVSPLTEDPTGSSDTIRNCGWTFISDNGGEWPIFGLIEYNF